MLVFEERGKPEYPEKILSEQGENQQQTQPTYDAGCGNRTRPHWWEASALTTTPPLLPLVKDPCREGQINSGFANTGTPILQIWSILLQIIATDFNEVIEGITLTPEI